MGVHLPVKVSFVEMDKYLGASCVIQDVHVKMGLIVLIILGYVLGSARLVLLHDVLQIVPMVIVVILSSILMG